MKTLISFVALLFVLPAGLLWAQEEEPSIDVRATALKINSLLQKKDFDGAEKALETAIKANPNNPQIQGLRRSLALGYSRAKRHEEAISHASQYVDMQLKTLEKTPALAASAASALDSLLFIAKKAEQSEAAQKKLDAVITAVADQYAKKPDASLADTLSKLKGTKITFLAEHKQQELAEALLQRELADARRAYALNMEKADLGATLALANLLSTQAELFETVSADKAPAAAKEYREFVAKQAKERSDKSEIVNLFVAAKMMEFYEVVQADPAAGEKIQAEFKEYLSNLAADNPQIKALATRGSQLLTGMTRRVESAKAHHAMIGKPATALDVEAWVNGAALSDKDLEGKVVLLDFWAVWCGPCIATFPHLRDWQEKYSDKGLVIIGMTNLYQYDWNDADEAIERVQGLEPEKEQAAMVRFAAYHKLKHRFAVMPKGSEFSESYGVQGIPQVVLIDRAGKVRMIRVGSGSRNAHDLEDAIKQALAVPAAGG